MSNAKKRYTTQELARIYDAKDWALLWKIMEPMVKHAVRRCMQEGLDPQYVREDLMQEANLAAWECLPRWNAFEGSLQTWICANVRIAVTDANRRQRSGMIGGRDSGPLVVSMHGDTPEDDYSSNDEQGLSAAPEQRVVYEEPPEGLGDPAEEPEFETLLAQVPERDRDMVRRLCGIGVPAETLKEYGAAVGLSWQGVASRVQKVQKILYKLKKLSLKPANHTVGNNGKHAGKHARQPTVRLRQLG